mmetsp:Transcript_5232/g.10760  ORF Transcript_5232/g.10760 Transcript_5232/m.10760 type:complete len:209 (-) Transcript_5232:6-632(-)
MTIQRFSRLLWTTLLLCCPDKGCAFTTSFPTSQQSSCLATPSTALSVVSIRVAQIPEDLPALRECRAVAFADKKSLLDSEKNFVNADQVVRNPRVTCVVASEGSKIVGTADVRLGKEEAYVNNVFVLPNQRGNGLGRRLMTEGIEELVLQASTDAPQKVTLTVQTKNTPAITLYEKLGYTPSGPANHLVKGISDTLGADLMLGMEKDL